MCLCLPCMIWDVSYFNYATAENYNAVYPSSGTLFTQQLLTKEIPRNHNAIYATTFGNPYYINMTSLFHAVYIKDSHGVAVGIYFEEHDVHPRTNFLAHAQTEIGMFIRPLPHGVHD